jgi:hypothetical protein
MARLTRNCRRIGLCARRVLCAVCKGIRVRIPSLKNRLERRYGQRHLYFITGSLLP